MKKRYPVRPPARIGKLYEEECDHCGSSGQEPDMADLTCRECMGRGRRKWRIEECGDCQGRGRKNFIFTCQSCRGRGWQARDVG